ncbi:MAG: hypothetical protein GY771_02150 [bacterium]|nr:hypothetical protein [bacterium]
MEILRKGLRRKRLEVGILVFITALGFAAGVGCTRVDEEGRPWRDEGYDDVPEGPAIPENQYLDSWNVGEEPAVRTYVHRYEYEGDTFLIFATRNRDGDALSTAVVEVK